MAKSKHKTISSRNQAHLASSKPCSPTTASPEYTITPEKQDSDLKSFLMMVIEHFKKDINDSLKEIQENTGKQKSLRRKHRNPLKNYKKTQPNR